MEAAVVDLFCGVGGLTSGLSKVGLNVVAGIDCDPDCEFPYRINNDADFLHQDISTLDSVRVSRCFPSRGPRILAGCAPCQPFSRYGRAAERRRSKWSLLTDFARIATEVHPEVVTMENVPEVLHHAAFTTFKQALESAGYNVVFGVLSCPEYGVPQNRRRLVLLASRLSSIRLPKPTPRSNGYKTVRSTIGGLRPLRAGEEDKHDALHRACHLSEINLDRIRASLPGGTWRDWPRALRARCHVSETGKTYPAVYGRMTWDEPAPTITTQFFGFGNGRFGHPSQDRAISLREGAMLQSFPKSYQFHSISSRLSAQRLGRLIGNAVPVRLGKAIGRAIRQHLTENGAHS